MREKSYKYILPDQNNNPDEKETNYQSMIIIGANGSGKSRLGVWIELNSLDKTHRISAQRSLIFNKYIELKSYKQSQNLLTFGAETPRESHDLRWNTGWNGGELDYTTSMLNDYEYVLSTLIAIQTKQQDKFIKDCKQKESQGEKHDEVPEMILDKLKRIWNTIFSHRTIDIKDGKVIATLKDFEYEGRAMSDGERVTL